MLDFPIFDMDSDDEIVGSLASAADGLAKTNSHAKTAAPQFTTDDAAVHGQGLASSSVWCCLCGKSAVGCHRSLCGRLVCDSRPCRNAARLWMPGQARALKPFAQKVQGSLSHGSPAAGGPSAGLPAPPPAPQQEQIDGAALQSCRDDLQKACDIPTFERIRRNRSFREHLVATSQARGLGRCQCSERCCLSSCLNAVLGIECSKANCNLRGDRSRCGNRQFAQVQRGDLDSLTEVVHVSEEKGFGLRAAKPLSVGQLVAEYLGDVMPQAQLSSHRYAMQLKNGVVIDASSAGGVARFMNHSCDPNCYSQRWIVGRELHIGLFAMRHTAVGEELTFCYARSERGFGGGTEQCHCSASSCSGVIGLPVCKTAASRRTRTKVARHISVEETTFRAHRRAALEDCGPSWPHARWLVGALCDTAGAFLPAAVLGTGPCDRHAGMGLEPFGVHSWPGDAEMSVVQSCGLYLPKTLAVGRDLWAKRAAELGALGDDLGRLLSHSLLSAEGCLECPGRGGTRRADEGGAGLLQRRGCGLLEGETPPKRLRRGSCPACMLDAAAPAVRTLEEVTAHLCGADMPLKPNSEHV